MVTTVTLLGILLSICIVAFLLNKRRLITSYYPQILNQEVLEEGVISLLTYNVAGLPEKISSAKSNRLDSILLIGERINSYDIVNVQEDFNYNIQLYMNNNHPYKSAHRGKALWGDGLNTFSRFPIKEFRRIAWKRCNGTDCLTPKGFSLARISLAKDVLVDVYNVHATSGNTPTAAKARKKNLIQLAEYIGIYSIDRPLIVMGDFNGYYQSNLDNMLYFLEETQLKDAWVSVMLNGKYPEIDKNFTFISDLEYTNYTESIDKILFRSSTRLTFEPLTFNVVIDDFMNDQLQHLSDHLALSTRLKWKFI